MRSRNVMVRGSRILGFALLAKYAHQPLRHHGFKRRCHEIRLDAHVHQPRQRARRVVCVQRGKNHVAGQRRLHGDLRRFLIANFTNEHDIRIVAKNGAQTARETSGPLFPRPESD